MNGLNELKIFDASWKEFDFFVRYPVSNCSYPVANVVKSFCQFAKQKLFHKVFHKETSQIGAVPSEDDGGRLRDGEGGVEVELEGGVDVGVRVLLPRSDLERPADSIKS